MQTLSPQDQQRRMPRLRSRHLAGVAGLAVVGAAAFALPAFAGNSPSPSSAAVPAVAGVDGDIGECIVATDADGEALLRHVGADPSKVAKPLPEGAEVIEGTTIDGPLPSKDWTPAKPLPKGATVTFEGVIEEAPPVDLPPGVTPAKPVPEGAKVIYSGTPAADAPGGVEAPIAIAVPAVPDGTVVSGSGEDVSDLPGCAELYGTK